MKPSNKITTANYISLQMTLMAISPSLVSRSFSRSISFEYIACSLHPLEKTVAYGVKRRHAHHALAHRRNPDVPAGDDERRAGPRNRLASPARRHYSVFRGGNRRSIRFHSIVQRAATPFQFRDVDRVKAAPHCTPFANPVSSPAHPSNPRTSARSSPPPESSH